MATEVGSEAAALYLPGLDIAAAGWHGGGVASRRIRAGRRALCRLTP